MFRAVACASAAALASAGSAPQGGNYQQFLDQWAGGYGHDYSQYMSGGQGAQADTSSATALGSFDYSNYMGGASGGSSSSSSGSSGYMQKYGDYSKYAGGNGSSGGGDYSNYSKYTGGSSGGGSSSYSKYYNYSKYTSGASGPSPAPQATGMVAAGGGDFMQKYGDWQSFVPAPPNQANSENGSGAGFNFSGYVPFNYSKYMHEDESPHNQTVMSATECHDMSCLEAWRAAQMSHVDKYSHYAPKSLKWLDMVYDVTTQDGQDAWSNMIKDQYETNKKRILLELQENVTIHWENPAPDLPPGAFWSDHPGHAGARWGRHYPGHAENVTILRPVQEPWWLIHGVTPDGTPEAVGGATFSRFSAAQQEHFGINAKGEVQDQAKFDKAIAALDAKNNHNTAAPNTTAAEEAHNISVTVTRDERNHSKEAAAARDVEANATVAASATAARAAVGTVLAAASAEGLSASPAEESRGVDPTRWVVLGCAMLVAAGVAVRAARARPLGGVPEEDPYQVYLALA